MPQSSMIRRQPQLQAETNDKVGQLGRFVAKPQAQDSDITWHYGEDCLLARQHIMRQRPATLWLTGLSGAGKSTIGFALEKKLLEIGHACFVLDGDNLRHHLNGDLGFSPQDRRENIRRAAEVAHLMNEAGLITIIAFISPFENDRAMAREIITKDCFIEVHVSTSANICEARDTKGLYARARKGEIAEFTGISSPYEKPATPDIDIDTELLSIDGAVTMLQQYLITHHFIK